MKSFNRWNIHDRNESSTNREGLHYSSPENN